LRALREPGSSAAGRVSISGHRPEVYPELDEGLDTNGGRVLDLRARLGAAGHPGKDQAGVAGVPV